MGEPENPRKLSKTLENSVDRDGEISIQEYLRATGGAGSNLAASTTPTPSRPSSSRRNPCNPSRFRRDQLQPWARTVATGPESTLKQASNNPRAWSAEGGIAVPGQLRAGETMADRVIPTPPFFTTPRRLAAGVRASSCPSITCFSGGSRLPGSRLAHRAQHRRGATFRLLFNVAASTAVFLATPARWLDSRCCPVQPFVWLGLILPRRGRWPRPLRRVATGLSRVRCSAVAGVPCDRRLLRDFALCC